MAEAAKIVEAEGFDEVNVNCGCPSSAVSGAGCFGASLMFDPLKVAKITATMRNTVDIPVTVKCRLGVDDHDKWENIVDFVKVVSEEGGVNKFIIHARKCHLKGLNPKENRTIPPLNYPWVYQLAIQFPHLKFILNGGLNSIPEIKTGLESGPVYGCMSGRLAMNEPWEMAKIDREIYGD